jgi:hypothetical protein
MARYAGARDGSAAEIELTRGAERAVAQAPPANGPTLARWRI